MNGILLTVLLSTQIPPHRILVKSHYTTFSMQDTGISPSPTLRVPFFQNIKVSCIKPVVYLMEGHPSRQHMRIHVRPFKCTLCGETAPYRKDIDRHLVAAHRVGSRDFYLCRCGTSFTRKDNALKHCRLKNCALQDS